MASIIRTTNLVFLIYFLLTCGITQERSQSAFYWDCREEKKVNIQILYNVYLVILSITSFLTKKIASMTEKLKSTER